MRDQVLREAPGLEIANYSHGYKPGESPQWFAYPYILVAVNTGVLLPMDNLALLETLPLDAKAQKLRETLKTALAGVVIENLHYEAQAGLLWTTMESTVAGLGPVSALIGIIPTATGFLQVECYARSDAFEKLRPAFRQAVWTLRLEKGAVRSAWTRAWQRAALAGAVLAVFAAALAASLKKRRRDKKETLL
jgi:hypothetical protein